MFECLLQFKYICFHGQICTMIYNYYIYNMSFHLQCKFKRMFKNMKIYAKEKGLNKNQVFP
jgi:hypothetical protein